MTSANSSYVIEHQLNLQIPITVLFWDHSSCVAMVQNIQQFLADSADRNGWQLEFTAHDLAGEKNIDFSKKTSALFLWIANPNLVDIEICQQIWAQTQNIFRQQASHKNFPSAHFWFGHLPSDLKTISTQLNAFYHFNFLDHYWEGLQALEGFVCTGLLSYFRPDILTNLLQNNLQWTLKNNKQLSIEELALQRLSVLQPLLGSGINSAEGANHYLSGWAQKAVVQQLKKEQKLTLNLELTEELSARDSLTGLRNAHVLDGKLQEMCAQQDSQSAFAVFFIDIDHFKRINDQYGHENGSRILSKLGHIFLVSIKQQDIAFRYGGDEFVILVQQVNTEQAVSIAQRLIKKIAMIPFDITLGAEKIKISLTMSLGIAMFPLHGDNPRSLLRKADGALYQAKEKGRNTWSLPIS